MATANLKSKISLDDTQFTAGLRRVKLTTAAAAKQIGTSFRKLGGIMANLAKSLARFAAIAGTITFAAAIAGAVKLGNALKKAFDAGGALSDLSAQTGIAVKELVILQQAFEDNGVAADQVGTVVNKLQRSISDFGNGLSTQVRAFERLGITYAELERKSPLQQFQMVQTAIARMEDPTKRAATAMEIFGRSGGNMLALFQDGNAISNAMVTVGGAADLLDKNATKFDRISDLLNSAGSKLQGFFVGVADVAADKILPVLEKFNSMDFASMGQNFAQNFDMEKLSKFLAAGIEVTVQAFGDGMIRAVTIAFAVFKNLFSKEGAEVMKRLFMSPFVEETGGRVYDAGGNLIEDPNDLTGDLTKLIQDTMDDVSSELDGIDSSGLGDAWKNWLEAGKDMFGGGSAKGFKRKPEDSEADLFEKELEEQRRRIFMDHYEPAGPPVPKDYAKRAQSGSLQAAVGAGASKISPQAQLQRKALKMSESAGAGFMGLAGYYGMQVAKGAGIGPGVGSTLSAGPRAVGGKAGAISRGNLNGLGGGLGAVRKVGAKADATAARRDETIGGTNKRIEETNILLNAQNELLQGAMN